MALFSMATLSGVGSTIANNRAVQWAIGVGLLIVGFLYWLAQHDRKLLENERLRQERRNLQKDKEIRDNSNEAVKTADTIRANTERVSATRMPDQPAPDYHYRD